MLADTSDIYALSGAQRHHADDLTAVAADLSAARVSPDAFGPVGTSFLAAWNAALLREAHHAGQLADRVAAATISTASAAAAYEEAELHAGQAISTAGS